MKNPATLFLSDDNKKYAHYGLNGLKLLLYLIDDKYNKVQDDNGRYVVKIMSKEKFINCVTNGSLKVIGFIN